MGIKHYLLCILSAMVVMLPLSARSKVNMPVGQRIKGLSLTRSHGIGKMIKSNVSAEDILGCPEGTVFGGEYVEGDGVYTGQSTADMGRTDYATKFYQQFSGCYYKFNGVRFVGMFKYWDDEEYNWFSCNSRGDIDENGDMTTPIRFEIGFYTMGDDGMPGEQIYKKEIDIVGEFLGLTHGDVVSGYSNIYSFTADLGQDVRLESGFMSVTAVDMGDKPSCWFSVFTSETSVGAGYVNMDGSQWMGQMPMIFCFKGDGSLSADKAIKLERILSPKSSDEGKYSKVQVEYSNIGAKDIDNVRLELWADGKLISTETVNETLHSMDSYKYTFDARVDLLSDGSHVIMVKNVTSGDEQLAAGDIKTTVYKMKEGEAVESRSDVYDYNYTTKVTIGSISNSSEASSYSDFTNHKTTISLGDELTLDIMQEGYGYIGAWIDWNGNGVFDDANEQVRLKTVGGDENHLSGTVAIPLGANIIPGDKRIRIVNSMYEPLSSGTYDYGETEDYTITVVARQGAPVITESCSFIEESVKDNSKTVAMDILNSGDGELQCTVSYSYILPKAPTANYSARSFNVEQRAKMRINRMPAREAYTSPKSDEQTQYVLRYDKEQHDIIGITNAETATYATYYPGAMLSGLKGMKISSVDIYIGDLPAESNLVVYGQKDQNNSGEVLVNQKVMPTEHSWNHFVLDAPVEISDKDLWIGINMSGFKPDDYSIGVDKGEAVLGFGDRVNIGGDTWWSMGDLGLSYNYSIRANVTGERTPAISWLSLDKTALKVSGGGKETVNVKLDSKNLDNSLYEAVIEIQSNDELRQTVKVPVYLINGTLSGIYESSVMDASIRFNNGTVEISSEKTVQNVVLTDMGGRVLKSHNVNGTEATVRIPATSSPVLVLTVGYSDGSKCAIKIPALK